MPEHLEDVDFSCHALDVGGILDLGLLEDFYSDLLI